MLLDKANKDLTDARGEADDAQRGAITMFNEQKRYNPMFIEPIVQ